MNIRKKTQQIAKVYFSDRKLYTDMLIKTVEKIEEEKLRILPQYFYDESIQCPSEISGECSGIGEWLNMRL